MNVKTLDSIAEKYAIEAVNNADIEASWLGFLKSTIKLACLESWKQGMTDAAAIVHSVDDPAVELAIQHQRDAALPNDRS